MSLHQEYFKEKHLVELLVPDAIRRITPDTMAQLGVTLLMAQINVILVRQYAKSINTTGLPRKRFTIEKTELAVEVNPWAVAEMQRLSKGYWYIIDQGEYLEILPDDPNMLEKLS